MKKYPAPVATPEEPAPVQPIAPASPPIIEKVTEVQVINIPELHVAARAMNETIRSQEAVIERLMEVIKTIESRDKGAIRIKVERNEEGVMNELVITRT